MTLSPSWTEGVLIGGNLSRVGGHSSPVSSSRLFEGTRKGPPMNRGAIGEGSASRSPRAARKGLFSGTVFGTDSL